MLYRFENGKPVAYRVVRAESSIRSVQTVYNLTTKAGAYVVAETVVLDK